MEKAPERQQSLVLVRQALELLGYRLCPVAPDLLKAEPPAREPAGRQAAFLITTNPVWVSRAPGVVLLAPGSGPARRLSRAVRDRGRFAVFAAQDPGHPQPLRRYLWFRFVSTVTGFALPEGARRSVIDVLPAATPKHRSAGRRRTCDSSPGRRRRWPG